MKVFFQASYTAREQYRDHYKKIYDAIKSLGYSLVSDEIVSVSTKDFYNEMSKKGREGQMELYISNTKWIQEADINVFETSVHSLGIGFLVQKSLEYGKPTIVLYLEDSPPHFLLGSKEEKLLLAPYSDKTIKKVLRDSLEAAKERRDKRFNFFISPKLLEYLENESKKMGVTKSKFIRDLIVAQMRSSEEQS